MKAGLFSLVEDVYYKGNSLEVENSNSLAKMLRIDGCRLKRLRANNGGYQFLRWLQFEKKSNRDMGDGLIQSFLKLGVEPKDIDFISDKMGAQKIYNYLQKQYQASGRKPKELLSTWQDYLIMSRRLKRNVTLELIYKPKNLIDAHDEIINLCQDKNIMLNAAEVAQKYPDVDRICESLKEKYEYQGDKYVMVAPRCIEDIMREGQALRHCTSWSDIYFERIQNRETFLLFLRNADKPEMPFYTLEIEPDGTARQKRTTGDKQDKDFDKAVSFIKEWQQILQERLTREDYELAKISAKLRVKELKELRDKKAKIWHGHLAGKLLADVLDDDLLEVERSKSSEDMAQLSRNKAELPIAA